MRREQGSDYIVIVRFRDAKPPDLSRRGLRTLEIVD
jgi:hypothetical protein